MQRDVTVKILSKLLRVKVVQTVQILLEKGARIELGGGEKRTLLEMIAAAGRYSVV